MNKKLKKDKLYICDIEYEYELESGTKGIAQDKLIGYVKGTEDCFSMALFIPKKTIATLAATQWVLL